MNIVMIGLVKVNVETIQNTCLLIAENPAIIVVIFNDIIKKLYILAIIHYKTAFYVCRNMYYRR